MKNKIIMLSGKAGSGKDTFFESIKNDEFFINDCKGLKILHPKRISFADSLKRLAKEFGWSGKKDIDGRNFLIVLGQYLGDEPITEKLKFTDLQRIYETSKYFTKDKLFWVKSIESKLEDLNIITDWRMLKEYYYLKYIKNYDVTTVRIVRENKKISDIDTPTETELDNFDFDYVIHNNESLDDLRMKANNLILDILSKQGLT
jgi:hypothetical protein